MHMESIDDYFEYAMDLAESQRQELLRRLRKEEPDLAKRLEAALADQVRNPDFLCQEQPVMRRADEPDVLHHVAVVVGDLDRAVQWYGEVFRAKLLRRDARRAVFAFGAVELHLVDEQQPAGVTIVRHDVAAMGPSTRRPDGVRGMHLVDPWGNAIEVVDRVHDALEP
jgi:predicted enzyme related to lactoylglutathione lyase